MDKKESWKPKIAAPYELDRPVLKLADVTGFDTYMKQMVELLERIDKNVREIKEKMK